MKKYVCYLQEGKNDCGPACIKSILKYYHGDYDYQKLKEKLYLDKSGTSAYHMVEFLNHHGFQAVGKKYDWQTWLKERKVFPLIALVKNEALQNHYVLIYQLYLKKEKVVLGDPKEGIKTISLKQFHSQFTGIEIQAIPISMIPCENHSTLKLKIKTFMIEHQKYVILFILLVFFFLLFQFITSFTTKYFVNGIDKQKSQDYFYSLFFLFLLFYVLKETYYKMLKQFLFSFQYRLQLLLEHDLYVSLLKENNMNLSRSEPIFFEQKKEELYIWLQALFHIVQFFIFDIPIFLLLVLCIYMIQIQLFYFLVPFFLFTVTYQVWVSKKMISKEKICRADIEKTNCFFFESMENHSFIQTAQLEYYFSEKYYNKLLHMNHSLRSFFHFQISTDFFYQLLLLFFYLYFLLFFSLKTITGKVMIGDFIFCFTLFQTLIPILKNISQISDYFQKLYFYYERICPFFQIQREKKLCPFLQFESLEIRQFSYYYHDTKLLLNDVNLMIYKGEKILLTGASGSGKSTFLKIMSGRIDIDHNFLFVNQLDICDYHKKDLFYKIALLTQEETLFQGTLFENVTLGRKVDSKELVKVLKCAKVDDIVYSHPLGLQQMITNHGSNLSGGERKRIILARLLLQPFDVLFIDEGFSEMDVTLERQITKNLFYTYFQKTFIIVSHRLNNLDLYGRHLVMKDGKIEDVKI